MSTNTTTETAAADYNPLVDVDLEEGDAAELKTAAAEKQRLAVVNPRVAALIKITTGVVVVLYVLMVIGMLVWLVSSAKHPWFTLPYVLVLSVIAICTVYKVLKATDEATRGTVASDNDVSTKLLASK
ncbi:hypothetical protein ACP70R_008081 [Stipagrostis hirtigluma subsp. patula]